MFYLERGTAEVAILLSDRKHASRCYQSRIEKSFKKSSDVDEAAPWRVTVRLHAPTRGWFTASLIIALIAVVDALSPVPYVTSYGIWVAILAYIVLAVGNLAPSVKE